jgi:(S)-citramalyl-CoA lyase
MTTVPLFVPGDRPDRFERALAAGADVVVIDLEDSVAPAGKDAARAEALRAIGPGVGVRLNALTTPAGIRDLAAMLDLAAGPELVVLPKVESAAEVRLCAEVLGGAAWPGELVCVIESGRGIEAAAKIATADPHVTALGFGGVDLAAALGAELAWEPMLPARGRVVWAAAAAGIGTLDVPCLDLDSTEMLAEECRRAKAMGFTGKIAIHPGQVAGIRAGFAPTDTEIAEARAILAAAGNSGVVRHGGRMIDAAAVSRARRLVESRDGRA